MRDSNAPARPAPLCAGGRSERHALVGACPGFSHYREDPIGRLAGTVGWIICVTYGATEQAHAETAHVGRLDRRVSGTYATAAGPRTYSASDAALVEWVHLAFTEAFLGAHQRGAARSAQAVG